MLRVLQLGSRSFKFKWFLGFVVVADIIPGKSCVFFHKWGFTRGSNIHNKGRAASGDAQAKSDLSPPTCGLSAPVRNLGPHGTQFENGHCGIFTCEGFISLGRNTASQTCRISGPILDLLYWNILFKKISRWFLQVLKFRSINLEDFGDVRIGKGTKYKFAYYRYGK